MRFFKKVRKFRKLKISLKKSNQQICEYSRFYTDLNSSWSPEVMASAKAMRHQNLNNRNYGRDIIVITIVIVVRTIQKRQIHAFPVVLAIVLPTQFVLLKIQYSCDFYVN